MRTAEPVHGIWCSARLKKTACGTCGKPLLLFFCDCGGIVMVEGQGAERSVHACTPGQNRFSVPDAFAIGRALDRRIDTADLEAGAIRPLRLAVEGAPLPPPEQWAEGEIRPVQGSFRSAQP